MQLLQDWFISKRNDLFFRASLWLLVILATLVATTLEVLHRFTFITFSAYVFPYLFAFLIWFCIGYFAVHRPWVKWIGVPLAISLIVVTIEGSFQYYYYLLPRWDIVFFSELTAARRIIFNTRVVTANLILMAVVSIDYFFWQRIVLQLEFSRIKSRLKMQEDSQLLSGHFISSLLNMAEDNRSISTADTVIFFRYIYTMLAQRKTLVALEEEWKHVKLLMQIASHRRFEVHGENLLSKRMWNRSVPALTLITWLENAIKYSPDNVMQPIYLEWTLLEGKLQLMVRNSVSTAVSPGTGKGLALVKQLYGEFMPDDAVIDYEIRNEQEFIVILTLTHKYA